MYFLIETFLDIWVKSWFAIGLKNEEDPGPMEEEKKREEELDLEEVEAMLDCINISIPMF